MAVISIIREITTNQVFGLPLRAGLATDGYLYLYFDDLCQAAGIEDIDAQLVHIQNNGALSSGFEQVPGDNGRHLFLRQDLVNIWVATLNLSQITNPDFKKSVQEQQILVANIMNAAIAETRQAKKRLFPDIAADMRIIYRQNLIRIGRDPASIPLHIVPFKCPVRAYVLPDVLGEKSYYIATFDPQMIVLEPEVFRPFHMALLEMGHVDYTIWILEDSDVKRIIRVKENQNDITFENVLETDKGG